MSAVTFLVAGRLDARTGGSIYNQRMVEALRSHGWTVDVQELDESFPSPTQDALSAAGRAFGTVAPRTLVVVDGLAFGAMPGIVDEVSRRLTLCALVHLPLAAAPGLPPEAAGRFADSERRALSCAKAVVVTGEHALSLMAQWGLAHDRIAIVEPGTARAPLARGSGSPHVHMLTVATLNAGKGHAVLVDALATLKDRPWTLTCAGSMTRDPGTARAVRAAIAGHGLEKRVTLAGDLDEAELDACYSRSDLVVLPSLRETYGMAAAEALARGLPVIATDTGAIPALLASGAGMVVPAGDRDALARAIGTMLDDNGVRARCAAAARTAREHLRDWNGAAREFADVLHQVNAHG